MFLVNFVPKHNLLGSGHTIKDVTTPNETTLLWVYQIIQNCTKFVSKNLHDYLKRPIEEANESKVIYTRQIILLGYKNDLCIILTVLVKSVVE